MHSVHNITNRVLFQKSWNPEIIEYYFYQIFSSIAYSLSGVFLPVYLYVNLEYSLIEIALFWVLNQIFFVGALPYAGKIIEKFGIKHTIAIHIPFMVAFWYSLRFLETGFFENILIIALLLAIRAIPKSFKETGEMVFISKNILRKKHYGSSLAKLRMGLIIATLLSPLFGGAIAYFFGFDMLFNAAILLLVISTIPFFWTKDSYFHVKLNPKRMWGLVLHKLPKNFVKAEVGRGFSNQAVWLLFPLFLYIVVQNTFDLGFLVTISGLVSIGIAYYIGKYADKFEPKKLLNNSVKIATGIFYFRTIFANPFLIAFTDILNRIFEPVFMVPYEKYLYVYINSHRDIVELSNAKCFIYEATAAFSFVIMAIIFHIGQLIGFTQESSIIFIVIFALFGIPILLMSKISEIEKSN